jgi:hypothetical protein
MASDELPDFQDGLILFFWTAGRNSYGKLIKRFYFHVKPFPIEMEEDKQGRYGDALVPVEKWTILDHQVKQHAGFRDKPSIERSAGKPLERGGKTTFKDVGEPGGVVGDRLIKG